MDKKENKTRLAKKLGVSRGILYYHHKQPLIDEEIKDLILATLKTHQDYGHKRIALELKLNKKRILRVMKKFGIKPYRRRAIFRKPADEGKPETIYPNLIKFFCPIKPNIVWVADFTYFFFQGQWYYLATVMDLFTREIIGWSFSDKHDTQLVIDAFNDAKEKTKTIPLYFHSDQGSEYDSKRNLNLIESGGTKISMSKKSSPWENAFQESFYSHFKVYLSHLERFNDLGELIEEMAQAIYYYNHERIHSTLKMSPIKFRLLKSREYLFKEMG